MPMLHNLCFAVLGDGNGLFSKQADYLLAQKNDTGPRAGFEVADLNKDGFVDVVVQSEETSTVSPLSILFGTADGKFDLQSPDLYQGYVGLGGQVLTGKFNMDEAVDIASVDEFQGFTVLLNRLFEGSGSGGGTGNTLINTQDSKVFTYDETFNQLTSIRLMGIGFLRER
jgi:hypothetical protein